MKIIFLSAIAVLSLNAFAAEAPENYKIQVDWNTKATLEDSVVQMCDDTYYSAIEIEVPGRNGKDFSIEMSVGIKDGRILKPGCNVRERVNSNSTTFYFDPANGGCSVRIFNLDRGQKYYSAVYEIGEAC